MSQPPLGPGGVGNAAGRLATSSRRRMEGCFKALCKEFYSVVHVALREWDEEMTDLPRRALTPPERPHQRLMVEQSDPTSGRARPERLALQGTSDRSLVRTEAERQLDRCIGASALSIGAALASVVFPPLSLLALGAGLYGGVRIFRHGYNALVNQGRLTMSVMLSLHFLGVFAGGFLIAGSLALLAYYLSEKLVSRTQRRSQQSLVEIFGEQPRTAWQLVDTVEVEVPVESLHAGDTVVVQAGQVIPVDGAIVRGIATVDQHRLTGESQPAEKGVGDPVLAGTLMMAGKVHVQVEKTGVETAAAQIGVILSNTALYQASIVSRGEQVADKSVGPTLILALIALPLAGYRYLVAILGAGIGLNIRLTAPISMLNFLNVAADQGILVKDGRSLELLKDVDTVVFDKTGTLTLDQPEIGLIHTCADEDAETVLGYAAAAEHRQTHPIARAVLMEAAKRGLSLPDVDQAQYQVGYGLRVQLADRLIRVGSDRYMGLEQIVIPDSIQGVLGAAHDQGHSLIMVAVNDQLVGAIELQTTLRPEVDAVVNELRRRQLRIVIMSGDQEQPTSKLAHELGISSYYSNTFPEEKASLVAQLQSEGRSVCFVGDGINDSISLKKANVSISLRGASTVATDSAQIVLTGQGLVQLPFVLQLASEFDSNMRAGYIVSVGQGVIVIGGALLAVVGIVPATLIWVSSLLVSLGIAQLPLRKHQIGRGTRPAAGGMAPGVVGVGRPVPSAGNVDQPR